MDFPEGITIPFAKWVNTFTDWVVVTFDDFFDVISDIIRAILLRIEDFLLWLPWFVVIILVCFAAWWFTRRWYMPVIFAVFLFLIGSFGLWNESMETLSLVLSGVILSLSIGIPIGILMGRSNLAESILKPVLDSMQTLPSFVYLVPILMLFGMGNVPGVIATIVYAMPPVIRLTSSGIRQVSPDVIEAASAFGAKPRQILVDVQLPLAIPSILVGINQTTMMALAMVVIASMVGAGGLGQEVLQGLQRLDIGRGFAAGISIVFLAIIIDRISSAMATKQQIKER